MNGFLRSYATPLSFITFLGVGVTGVLLLFDVRSRVLGEVHEWIGIAFLAALVLHLARNWRGVLGMLSTPRSKLIVGTTGLAMAFLIALSVPMGGQGHGGGHGPGMIMHRMASAPIERVAPALGLSSDEAVQRLRRGGVVVENPHQSLSEIATTQDEPLPRLFNLLLSEDA